MDERMVLYSEKSMSTKLKGILMMIWEDNISTKNVKFNKKGSAGQLFLSNKKVYSSMESK